ncbi:hypothetical protein AB0L06_27750 [Spirillospora sp. NPDC052269]
MTSPEQESSALVLVESHQFTLQEIAESQGLDGSAPALGDRLVFETPYLYIVSPGEDHYPLVTLQQWSQEPAPASTVWKHLGLFRVRLDGEEVEAWALTQGPSEARLTVTPGWYGLRVLCKGSEKLQGRAGGFPEGLEQYLLQLWPS